MLTIRFSSVMVQDQDKALKFYTEVLGFTKCADIPMGQYRWLTVATAGTPPAVELVLEPIGFPPAQTFQKALFDAGIPLTALTTDDIQAEYERLTALGVTFRSEPVEMGPIFATLFEDTCGNLINLVQPAG